MKAPVKMGRTARSADDLAGAGLIDQADVDALQAVADQYSVAITPDLSELIDTADRTDPITAQFVPSLAELDRRPEDLADPIGDDTHSPVKGIVHRYRDRVLLKPLLTCPVYCRFCFRRERVGTGAKALTTEELQAALRYIHDNDSIWEVILTGGDPLMLTPERLGMIADALAEMPHVRILRLHTRVPVAEPRRIDDRLIAAMRRDRLTTYIALHCNHARELTTAALQALASIVDAGIPMLGQTVLLKNVNDDVATLEALFRSLVENRVKPYYLHHGDLAPGTAHFRTGIDEGQKLVSDLRGSVSGLCQPTYVLDIPGGHGKAPIGPSHADRQDDDGWTIRDPEGGSHPYPPER